jgi:hypothetical protein
MGVTSSQYIICSAEYHSKRKVLQAGNREWVTVVEAINAEGGFLPPYLIFKDGHSSHLTPQFDKLCEENKIICLCMPAHASHLLQPLDVGCFSNTKKGIWRVDWGRDAERGEFD